MTIMPFEEGAALTPTVDAVHLDLTSSTALDFTSSTGIEFCAAPSEFLTSPLAGGEGIADDGGASCLICLGCVVAAGYCLVSGGLACVAAVPAHLWTGILAGCSGACANCAFGEEEE